MSQGHGTMGSDDQRLGSKRRSVITVSQSTSINYYRSASKHGLCDATRIHSMFIDIYTKMRLNLVTADWMHGFGSPIREGCSVFDPATERPPSSHCQRLLCRPQRALSKRWALSALKSTYINIALGEIGRSGGAFVVDFV